MAQSASSAKVTTDHGLIQKWVEARGGHPATVKRTSRRGEPGLLRIDYPGFGGDQAFKAISWEEFFEKFEESKLAFIYQDRTASGRPSRFSKLVARDTVDERARGGRRSRRRKTGAAGRSGAQSGSRAQKAPKRKATSGTTKRKSSSERTVRRSTRSAKRRTRRTRG
jgi:hypothetical protein